jgi:hypothetical protein
VLSGVIAALSKGAVFKEVVDEGVRELIGANSPAAVLAGFYFG